MNTLSTVQDSILTHTDLEIIKAQQLHLKAGKTLPLAQRLELLKSLLLMLNQRESEILLALNQDLGKPATEAFASEYAAVLGDLKLAIRSLKNWMKGKKVSTNLLNFGAKSHLYPLPYGQVLIFAPWNYPFQLIFLPLIGALAAGNTIIAKPSEMTPNTAAVIHSIITQTLPREIAWVIQGGAPVAEALLAHRWDYIFFTGSTNVGRFIYQKAAQHLTPVTLELGGKSPCIVTESAQLKTAARKIIWGKFFNCGQTCVAPDYLLIHESIYGAFLKELKNCLIQFYGENPKQNPDYGRIVNQHHFKRLVQLAKSAGHPIAAEHLDEDQKFIAPQLIEHPAMDSALMQEEIFGPLLPLLTYQNFDQAMTIVRRYPTPLAAYLFSNETQEQKTFNEELAFGGGCINDTMVHLSNPHLAFGGMGPSGIGKYRGHYTFETFSHYKSVLAYSTSHDMPLRYPPYKGKEKLVRWVCSRF